MSIEWKLRQFWYHLLSLFVAWCCAVAVHILPSRREHWIAVQFPGNWCNVQCELVWAVKYRRLYTRVGMPEAMYLGPWRWWWRRWCVFVCFVYIKWVIGSSHRWIHTFPQRFLAPSPSPAAIRATVLYYYFFICNFTTKINRVNARLWVQRMNERQNGTLSWFVRWMSLPMFPWHSSIAQLHAQHKAHTHTLEAFVLYLL